MSNRKSARWHTLYSIISTLIEEVIIIAFILWILPLFDVHIPVWGTIIILVVFTGFSYLMYRVGHPTISYQYASAPENIIGSIGVVENDVDPEGYVKVQGELWRAVVDEGKLIKGDEVIVTGIDGLKLTVRRK